MNQEPENIDTTPNEIKKEEPAKKENAKKAKQKKIPTIIEMTKDFRIQYPLPCRRDASMLLKLNAGEEITDKFVIEHLLSNPDAPFIIKQ